MTIVGNPNQWSLTTWSDPLVLPESILFVSLTDRGSSSWFLSFFTHAHHACAVVKLVGEDHFPGIGISAYRVFYYFGDMLQRRVPRPSSH